MSIIAPRRGHVQKTNTQKALARRLAAWLKLEDNTAEGIDGPSDHQWCGAALWQFGLQVNAYK